MENISFLYSVTNFLLPWILLAPCFIQLHGLWSLSRLNHLTLLLLCEWRRQWQPTPVLSPGKSHGRRSLVGYSPWGRKESVTTERLHFHFSLSSIGEGNGSPLQCSCLENPRDGGAWWAAVSGVAQSQTRLKWLSSSSIHMSRISWTSLPPHDTPLGSNFQNGLC